MRVEFCIGELDRFALLKIAYISPGPANFEPFE